MLSIRKSLLHCSYRVKGYYAAHCSSCNGYLTTLNIEYLASFKIFFIINRHPARVKTTEPGAEQGNHGSVPLVLRPPGSASPLVLLNFYC